MFRLDEDVLSEHWDWSQKNFGTREERGPVASLKHLSVEAIEAADDPHDIYEYADCMFLLIDAMNRAGFTVDNLREAMVSKMEILHTRTYKKTGPLEPSFHIKETHNDQ